MTRSWMLAMIRKWCAKCHRKALDRMIEAAEEAVEHAKTNNLSRQEIINAENELAKAVQAKNSQYQVQKVGLNTEAQSDNEHRRSTNWCGTRDHPLSRTVCSPDWRSGHPQPCQHAIRSIQWYCLYDTGSAGWGTTHRDKSVLTQAGVKLDPDVRGRPVFCSQNISKSFQLQHRTPSAFFGLWPPPSSRDTSEYFLFQAPSSSPQRYCTLLPLWPLAQHPLQWLLQDLHLLQR